MQRPGNELAVSNRGVGDEDNFGRAKAILSEKLSLQWSVGMATGKIFKFSHLKCEFPAFLARTTVRQSIEVIEKKLLQQKSIEVIE